MNLLLMRCAESLRPSKRTQALAYLETLGSSDRFFHDGTAAGISRSLMSFAKDRNSPGETVSTSGVNSSRVDRHADVERFLWPTRSSELDLAVDKLCEHA